MRTITAAQQAALDGQSRGIRLRVRIKDASGTWQDLTALGPYSMPFLKALDWGETVDDPHVTANITLARQIYDANASPFMDSSPVNKGWDAAGALSKLIALRREVQIQAQYGAADVDSPGDWMTLFHGRIDRFSAPEDPMTLECRDLSGVIQDTLIEEEKAYGYTGAAAGAGIWQDQHDYALNDRILPSGALTGYLYKCTTAGTSGTSEPSWPTTIAGTVTDGTAEWTCEVATTEGLDVEDVIQQILDDNLETAVTLYVPSSPGWQVGAFKTNREGTLEAVRRLAQQQGSDVRQLWRESTSQFELTYCTPDREKSVADRTFAVGELRSITRLGQDIAGIRNVVRVIYSDPADLASDGKTPKRKVVEVEDTDSITDYGRRFMEIAEDSNSQIDSQTEAEDLAGFALADLAQPVAEMEIDAAFFPWAELGDLYTFTADDVHFDSDQTLAVTGYRHSASIADDGTLSVSTVLSCRGKPSGGYMRWHEVEAKPGVGQSHQLKQIGGGQVTAIPAPGGGKLDIDYDRAIDGFWDGAEVHVSTSSNIVPTSTTLKDLVKGTSVVLNDLEPGRTHYVRVVRRGKNAGKPIFSEPSPEISFVAGRLKAAHFDPRLGGQMALPPNGDFESYWGEDSGAAPPDFWSTSAGTWDTHVYACKEDSRSGAVCVEIIDSGAEVFGLQSELFAIPGGVTYTLRAWLKALGSPELGMTAVITVSWYDRDEALISSTTLSTDLSTIGTGWTEVSGSQVAPSGATFAKVKVAKGAASAYGFRFDALSLTR